MTVVVKLGGSLLGDAPCLRAWLALLADAAAMHVVVVPGGGGFADAVRSAQGRWGCADLAAHNMAVLAMAQTAYLLQSLCPTLRLADSDAALQATLTTGVAAVWLPFSALRDAPDAGTDWRTTSDSLALGLADRLHADDLVLVKSCAVGAGRSWAAQSAAGTVDAAFPALAATARCRIRVLEKTDFGAMRRLLGQD